MNTEQSFTPDQVRLFAIQEASALSRAVGGLPVADTIAAAEMITAFVTSGTMPQQKAT